MPFVNGKFIFPLLVIACISLLSIFSKNYFTEKVNFTNEKNIDQLASIFPNTSFDTNVIAQKIIPQIITFNNSTELFKNLQDSLSKKNTTSEKVVYTKSFIKNYNSEQSRTQKISLIIFWCLMIALAVLAFLKNYSLIPLLGVSTCLYLLTGMTLSNWVWFGGWLAIGLVVYFLYGFKKSKLAQQ
jgi:C-terminus of AA_permease